MRRWAWLFGFLAGCLGQSGPDLPPNLGLTHYEGERSSGSSSREPEPDPEPLEVGTQVWAEFRNTGFFFHGVVVERREESHRVIYADGASEWLDADALRPDSLGVEAQVHVRPTYEGEFAEGVVARRFGQAVYVRFAGGDERWTALPHLRFQLGDEQIPRRGEAAIASVEGVEPGAAVLVNYQLAGFRFVAIVTARRDDGRLHVVYLDGEREWVAPELVEPEALQAGDVVHVRRRWEPAEWVRGRISARYGHAIQVELDDGGVAWTALLRVRAPVAPNASTPPSEAGPESVDESDQSDQPAPES